MATKVYVLAEEMRVTNAPYSLQGTQLRYDIPHEYPLPFETEVIEDGVPKSLRFVPNSKLIDKQQQIDQEKRPPAIVPSDADRKLLTFLEGRLELDTTRNQNAIEFMEAVGWNKKNAHLRPSGVKVLFEEYQEEELLDQTLRKEELVALAKSAVLALKDKELRDLFLLSIPGGYDSTQTTGTKMKVHLLDIAAANPQFVLDGVKSGRDRAVITLTKAVDYKIVTLSLNGLVAIKGIKKGAWDPLFELSEAGGPEGKFNRAVDYFLTDQGAASYKIIETRVVEIETKALEEEPVNV